VRILLLNLYYPPDTSATAKMAQEVVTALAAEHELTVLCGRPSYDPTERRRWRIWQTEQTRNAKIVRMGSTDYPRFVMRRRVLNYLTYVALAVPFALAVPCDMVLAMTDPPFEGIVGAFVALLKGKPYLYNIRDMYPDMAVGGALVAPGMLARIWEKLHRWALRRATRIVVLGDDMRARIVAKGVNAARVAVVRDGAERRATGLIETSSTSLIETSIDPEVVGAIRGDFRFVLLHAGNLGFYGAWETLIRAAAMLSDDGIGLVFVGEGAQRSQLQAAAASLRNVRFLPFFPTSKIPSVLEAADAHVITIKRGLEGVVVPSKMYGILAAGKPILAVAPKETDAAAMSVQIGCGIYADPDKVEEVAAAMKTLSKDTSRVKAMGAAAQNAAHRYDRAAETHKFLEIVNEMVRA
jgi:colanic acid biosynthesis glycosyl transferase WcaI